MKKFRVKRQVIACEARKLLGLPFIHQGRNELGLDCVGLLVQVAKTINYPNIIDAENYQRTPSASVLENLMAENCDEIPLAEAGLGDFILMRLGGAKPRHVAIISNVEIDNVRAIEPMMIHALSNGNIHRVVEQPLSDWRNQFYKAYRIRGLVD